MVVVVVVVALVLVLVVEVVVEFFLFVHVPRPLSLHLGGRLQRHIINLLNQQLASTLDKLWAPSCPARVFPTPSLTDFRSETDPGAVAVSRARHTVDAFGASGLNRLFDRITPKTLGEIRLANLASVRFNCLSCVYIDRHMYICIYR